MKSIDIFRKENCRKMKKKKIPLKKVYIIVGAVFEKKTEK